MDSIHAVILGIVQGLTEFLPISSSAHLVLAPWFFNFTDPGLAFDVAIHAGTLLAILVYFFKDWLQIFRGCFKGERQSLLMMGYIILATIPAVVAGLILNDWIERNVRHPLIIAFTLSALGALLLWADRRVKNGKNLNQIGLPEALTIGVAQAFALIPGVSRSGVTMTTGLFLGLSRVAAARFSFLMATPVTLGACLFKGKEILGSPIENQIWIGIAGSAITGFLAIRYLLKWVQTRNYEVFAYYRFALTGVILIKYFFFS